MQRVYASVDKPGLAKKPPSYVPIVLFEQTSTQKVTNFPVVNKTPVGYHSYDV